MTSKTNISLAISRAEFTALFPGKEDLYTLLTNRPKNAKDLKTNYLTSKLWRVNNLYWIKDKQGERVIFRMNRAQWIVYAHMLIHPRLLILKSRQQGISTLYLVLFFDDTMTQSFLESGLMAQDQAAATKLLDRVKFLWTNLDPEVKSFLGIKKIKQNASECSYSNSSQLYIRTSFRSATLQRLHISELGKIANKNPEKAKETKTGTLQTLAPGNIGIIESTAEGNNMFKHMFDAGVVIKKRALALLEYTEEGATAVDGTVFPGLKRSDPDLIKLWGVEYIHALQPHIAAKDFYPVFLSWMFDPDCREVVEQHVTAKVNNYFTKLERESDLTLSKEQRNFWIAQERELEGMIYQEYPATPAEAFSAAKDGTFWSRSYVELVLNAKRRKPTLELYDPNLRVYCSIDLGRNDYMVLVFFQYYEAPHGSKQFRIIGEYYNTGESIRHYAMYLKQTLDFMPELPWKPSDVETVILPHDAMVVDLSSENGDTREQLFNTYGITNTFVLGKTTLAVGIEAVREALEYTWISEDCSYLESCYLNYSKAWNALLNTWNSDAKHDDYSHGADAIRYAAVYTNDYLVGSASHSRSRKTPYLGV